MENIILIIKSIIMGIVEGVTEFLPISSTGHLLVTAELIDFDYGFTKSFIFIIQLGAILAVVVYYKDKIYGSLKTIRNRDWGFHMWLNVLIGIIPAGVIGVLFNSAIEKHLLRIEVVGVALVAGSVLLIIGDRISESHATVNTIDELRYRDAFVIGIFQCLAIIPGMSRSASSIVGGLFKGLNRRLAAEFSFFMAIPIMLGASIFEIKHVEFDGGAEIIALAVGFVVSFFVAYIVIDKFLNYLTNHNFNIFIIYRIIVGILILIYATVVA